MTRQIFGIHILRLALAFVFLWFGFSQIIDSLSWVSMIPQWIVDLLHIPPAMIVMANGSFEIILGSFLALGFFVRSISCVFALHLLPIIFEFGFEATAVRDIGIMFACVALCLIYEKKY